MLTLCSDKKYGITAAVAIHVTKVIMLYPHRTYDVFKERNCVVKATKRLTTCLLYIRDQPGSNPSNLECKNKNSKIMGKQWRRLHQTVLLRYFEITRQTTRQSFTIFVGHAMFQQSPFVSHLALLLPHNSISI